MRGRPEDGSGTCFRLSRIQIMEYASDSSLRWTGRISVVWLEVQAGRAEAHIQIPAGSPRRNTSRPLLRWKGQNLAEASATAQRIAVAFGEAQTGGRDRAFFYRASKQTAVAPGRDR